MKILSNWLRSYLPELELADKKLAEDLTLRGIAVEGIFDLGAHGSLFDMDITTNRVDAMNHYGIAREIAAIYNLQLQPLQIELPAARPVNDPYPITIEAPELCGRFTARVLRDIKITPSHGLIAERFRLLEQKLISNAVDATNYVTLAIGQPTHTFDLDKLEGGIVVRLARKGERLRTLDGVERELDPDDLVVADHSKPLGIAGVMGGWDSMITAETRNILVEAAWFDPAAVRRSARRHGLHTDASHRFERGAHFNAPPVANALVSQIVLEAGGEIEGGLVDIVILDAQARAANRPAIRLQVSEVQRILGATEDPAGITAETTESVLSALGCKLEKSGGDEYAVTLPSWRLDLDREIDLIEEVARVYGYNRFANTLPDFAGSVVELPFAGKEQTLRRTLLALGWNEAVSSTFCSVTDAVTFAPQPDSAVKIGNPLNEEAGMLRPSLVPGMLTMLGGNLNRDIENVALFELGTAFSGTTDKVEERPALAFGATGHLGASSPFHQPEAVDFYTLKGAVEELLSKFSARSKYIDAFPIESGLLPEWLHPGRAARAVIDGITVGYFGQLHPNEAQQRKLKQPVYIGELYLDRLYRQSLRQPAAGELSRYPAVRRDFSFVFPDMVKWGEIDAALESLAIPELTAIEPKEVLRDPKGLRIPTGHYSLLIGTVFQSEARTLRDDDLQAFSSAIVQVLKSKGGHLRT
ncbi:Phenylalanyl-tRNA synthetase beta chain [Acidisarcina polymorpha]|uniref:Phenylalanine--tRNA ligase beta subunit n=1 Tax=Acidisarcina polymorpha TaxID=2211140 RepID=A0A2Z5G5D7_9BACT|nr:phenylalanine--tRNA ligase subunit beta [Acidisarcina polymorpha]AXC14301.1 Phenylalanyl-tRNA synthetase beta chain [Acidisarcina polymorpha]